MYRTMLCSAGNPDHGQYSAPSIPQAIMASSLEEASAACRKYIAQWNLGSGNWCGEAGKVYRAEKLVATIAYNGRICPA